MFRLTPFTWGTTVENNGRFSTVKGNEPLARPGCYGVFDRRCCKWYIGQSSNIRQRWHDHAREWVRQKTAFHRSIKTQGDLRYLIFVPLYYMLPVRQLLLEAETALIQGFSSEAPKGYNNHASKRDPKFWASLCSPEARAKQQAHRQTAKFREGAASWLNSDDAINKRKATMATPEVKARKQASQRKAMSSPAYKAKHASIMAEINSRPEVNTKRSASVKDSWTTRRELYGAKGYRQPTK